MRTLLLTAAAVVVLVVIAGLRPALAQVTWALLGLVVRATNVVQRSLRVTRRMLVRGARSTRAALAYQTPHSTPHPATAWDLTAPVVFAVLAVLVVGGDLVLAMLRMGALLGLPMEGLPVPGPVVDVLAGVLFLAVLATFGLLLLDVLHVTPTVRPFGLAGPKAHRVLAAAAWAGTALSVVAGVIFLAWGQGAVEGAPNDDLATLFVVVFAVLLVVGSIVSVAGALGFPLVVWLAVQHVLAVAALLLGWLIQAAVALVQGVHDLLQAVLRLVARPGEIGWNWLCARGFAQRAGFAPLPPAGLLPPLGASWPGTRGDSPPTGPSLARSAA